MTASPPISALDHVAAILFDMEDLVLDVERFATLLKDLGTAEGGVGSESVFIVGRMLAPVAATLKRDRLRCMDILNERQGGGR